MAGDGDGRRVVFFPCPLPGHDTPMLLLAGALHAHGFAVTVFHTELVAPDLADYPADYRFVSLPVEVALEVVAPEDMAVLNDSSKAPFKARLAAALAEEGAGVRCVIADVLLYRAQAVARSLGVPVLGVMTDTAATFRMYMASNTLTDNGYLQAGVSKYAALHLLLRLTIDGARQSSGLIINTLGAIEAADLVKIREDLSVPVFDLEPLHKLAPPANTGSRLYGSNSTVQAMSVEALASQYLQKLKNTAAMEEMMDDEGISMKMSGFRLAAREAISAQTDLIALVDLIKSF